MEEEEQEEEEEDDDDDEEFCPKGNTLLKILYLLSFLSLRPFMSYDICQILHSI